MTRARHPRSTRDTRHEAGGVLVEFALVALVLYLLVAGGIALSRGVFQAQAAQEVARFAARELALLPLDADTTFEAALNDPLVRANVYDPGLLAIDLDAVAGAGLTLDAYFAGLPTVNRALRPLMIFEAVEIDGAKRRLLHMPGALLEDPSSPFGLTVGVPLVVARADGGGETIRWLDVIEEVRTDPDDPTTGPFSALREGIVAVRVNVAFQAAGLSAFRPAADGPFETNAGNVIGADDDAVTAVNAAPGALLDVNSTTGFSPYEGRYGLGRQAAFGRAVRPFRRVLSGQALFRREAFAPPR